MDYIKQFRERISWWHWLAAGMITVVLIYATWAMSR